MNKIKVALFGSDEFLMSIIGRALTIFAPEDKNLDIVSYEVPYPPGKPLLWDNYDVQDLITHFFTYNIVITFIRESDLENNELLDKYLLVLGQLPQNIQQVFIVQNPMFSSSDQQQITNHDHKLFRNHYLFAEEEKKTNIPFINVTKYPEEMYGYMLNIILESESTTH